MKRQIKYVYPGNFVFGMAFLRRKLCVSVGGSLGKAAVTVHRQALLEPKVLYDNIVATDFADAFL